MSRFIPGAMLLILPFTMSADVVAQDTDQTVKVVAAANALLATLDDSQRSKLLFKFNDEAQRVKWSNLPSGIFERAGLRIGDLKKEQYDAVMNLLSMTLSAEGFRQVVDSMNADETLNSGGRRGRTVFGKDEFFLSILGTPSRTEPWMWQFGGHHLAFNATVVGDRITLAPTLTGGQPMHYSLNGKEIGQMAAEVALAFELAGSLDAAQKQKAVLSSRFANMALGPGRDDVKLATEGIRATELTAKQQALLTNLIEQRIGLLNDEDAADKMAAVKAGMGETWFSWHGATEKDGAAYYRIQGPTFFMEFAPQQMGGAPMEHTHAMYREPGNDYGESLIQRQP